MPTIKDPSGKLERFTPTDMTVRYEDVETNTQVFYSSFGQRPCAYAYTGRSTKPENFYFPTPESREHWVTSFIARVASDKERQDKRKAEKTAAAKALQSHAIKVGDVFYSMWGYEQTNVDFYEIVSLVGARSVIAHQISRQTSHDHDMSGTCVPALGKFLEREKPFKALLQGDASCPYFKVGRQQAQFHKPKAVIGEMRIYDPLTWSSCH